MNYDVAVVGAGPVGSIAAAEAAQEKDTLLLGQYDKRMRCAGLISKSGLEEIGCAFKSLALNKVRGSKIYSPGGVEIRVDGKNEKAWVLDRVEFDKKTYERAQDQGAHVEPLWCDAITKDGLTVSGGKKFRAEKKILACGTNYHLHQRLGLDYPKKFLLGAQYELKVECETDFVELHFNVPGFFTWIIPTQEGRARVGLATYTQPKRHLDVFVKKLKAQYRLSNDTIYCENYGVIPVYDPGLQIQYDDISLVGDACAQVKATSGGGVVYGGRAAYHAHKPDYKKIVDSQLSTELRLHLVLHNFLNRLSDSRMDDFFKLISSKKHILESQGDMDSAKKTVLSMISNPSFLAGFLLRSPGLFYDFFLKSF